MEKTEDSSHELFSSQVVVGGFHIAMVFIGIISKWFGDAGLHDLMVESGIVGPYAISKVLSGKHYNRGMRSHQIAMEAFQRLLWRKFEQFLEGRHDEMTVLSEELKSALNHLRVERFSSEALGKFLKCRQFVSLHQAYCQFRASLQSPMAKL